LTAEPDEGTFAGSRGREIFWRCWRPDDAPTAVVVLAHGLGEHSGRYQHVAERLTGAGYALYALDHHGHGRSAGRRALVSYADALADLDQLVTLAESREPPVKRFLMGHSMGGGFSLRYAMDYGDRVSGLILCSPLAAVAGRAASKAIGRLLGPILPNVPVAGLDPSQLCRDPAFVAAYVADPLVNHRGIPIGTVAEILRQVDALPAEVPRVTLPTLLMYGTGDLITAPSGAVMVSQRIGTSDLTTTPYEGLYHELLNEPERETVIEQLLGWIAARRS
jgi:lysophospholipase